MAMTAARKRPTGELIQIAGVQNRRDLETLSSLGVPLIGFPLRLDVHPTDLGDAEAAELAACIAPPARGVLITYLSRAVEIETVANWLGLETIQIHGARRCQNCGPSAGRDRIGG